MAKKLVKRQGLEIIDVNDIKSGMQIRVHQKIKDVNAKNEEKERIQVFEGLVLSKKHGNEAGSTFIVRKVSDKIGVEKTYPTHSPLIEKVELVDTKMVNRSKLYFTRDYKKRIKSVSETKLTVAKGTQPEKPKKKSTKKAETKE